MVGRKSIIILPRHIILEDITHYHECSITQPTLSKDTIVLVMAQYTKRNIESISTGSKNLDNLLDGNVIETQAITQFYGAAGSGRLLQFMYGLQKQNPCCKVTYLYVESKFRPEEFLKLQ
jgi:RecA/RadA recombinase